MTTAVGSGDIPSIGTRLSPAVVTPVADADYFCLQEVDQNANAKSDAVPNK